MKRFSSILQLVRDLFGSQESPQIIDYDLIQVDERRGSVDIRLAAARAADGTTSLLVSAVIVSP